VLISYNIYTYTSVGSESVKNKEDIFVTQVPAWKFYNQLPGKINVSLLRFFN